MKIRYRTIVILLILGGIFNINKVYAQSDPIHILVFSKTAGFRHQSIPDGIQAIKKLAKDNQWEIDATEDATQFNEPNLLQYDVIIFLSTTGDVLSEEQQEAMKNWVQQGGGFVGIHAASDTEFDWPWYNDLVGAYFSNHPHIQEAAIDRLDDSFIATKHLPLRWVRTDEWYNFKSIKPHIHPVLNLDETSYEGGTNGPNHPVSWYHAFDGGRSFYTALGHTKESFSEPLFLEHILGAIQYAAGKL